MNPDSDSGIDRLLAPLVRWPEANGEPGDSSGEPTWFKAAGWRVFAKPRRILETGIPIETFALDGRYAHAWWDEGSCDVSVPFSLEEAFDNLVLEHWLQGVRGRKLGASNLALYYRVKHVIPRRVQLGARRVLARWQGVPEFPSWPLELSVVELLRFYVRCALLGSGSAELHFRWFWPDAKLAALTFTHDVETSEGLRLSIDLADLEEARGLRSSFNVVASSYPIDMGIVRELHARGFEVGVHGVYHDRSMFSSREQFESQQPAVRDAVDLFGAAGFRSPATHRVVEWLGDLPVLYDCSIPHSDPYEPQPGGCCSIWPFFIGDVVELPYTLPQDHTLFTILGHTTIDLWLRQVDELVALNGLIQIVSHPDPGYLGDPDKRKLYSEMLDAVSDRADLWSTLPRDVAAWWIQRDVGAEGPFRGVIGAARLVDGDVELVPQV